LPQPKSSFGLLIRTLDVDDCRTCSNPEQDHGSLFEPRIPFAMYYAPRHMDKVPGAGLDVVQAARPELHQNSSLGYVKIGVVFTVVVPRGRASRGSTD
jgi:hypothetical protein